MGEKCRYFSTMEITWTRMTALRQAEMENKELREKLRAALEDKMKSFDRWLMPREHKRRYLRVGCTECGAKPGQMCRDHSAGLFVEAHGCRKQLVDRWMEMCGSLP